MQIFLVFQSPPLLSLTQDKFLDIRSHEMKVCPASQLHKNPSTHDLQPLPALFLDPKERIMCIPLATGFSLRDSRDAKMWASVLEGFWEYVSGSWLAG